LFALAQGGRCCYFDTPHSLIPLPDGGAPERAIAGAVTGRVLLPFHGLKSKLFQAVDRAEAAAVIGVFLFVVSMPKWIVWHSFCNHCCKTKLL
jgi:hypothetical protein